MIMRIDDRLNAWADWCIRGRRVVGLGYPSKVAFYRLAPMPGTAMVPIPDEECWETEQAVHRLDERLQAVVEQFYLHTGTAETHAKALRCCRDTLYARLHQAHVGIMEYLRVGDDAEPVKKLLTPSDTFCKKQVS